MTDLPRNSVRPEVVSFLDRLNEPLVRQAAAQTVQAVVPHLSPIEMMNKPVQGAKGGAGLAGVGGAIIILMQSAGWLPAAWADPVPATALGLVAGWAFSAVGNFIASYLARDKRLEAVIQQVNAVPTVQVVDPPSITK